MVTTSTRLRWLPIYMGEGHAYRCSHCTLVKSDHILHRYGDGRRDPHLYCPEWRLRQMDGDR